MSRVAVFFDVFANDNEMDGFAMKAMKVENIMTGVDSPVTRAPSADQLKERVLIGTLAWAAERDIPFAEALKALVQDRCKDDFLRRGFYVAVNSVANDLENGVDLSAAMRKRLHHYFPPYLFAALENGERRRRLSIVLRRLAEDGRYSDEVFKSYWRPLIGVGLMLVNIFVIASMLGLFIVPKFNKIAEELMEGHPYPWFSKLVFQCASHIGTALEVMSLIFCLIYAIRQLVIHSNAVKMVWEWILLRIPLLGREYKRLGLVELSGAMTAFLALGDDVGTAAENASRSLRHLWLRRKLNAFAEKVKNGVPWFDAWRGMNLSHPLSEWLLANAAAREDPGAGFRQIEQWTRDEIAFTSETRGGVIEFCGVMINATLVASVVIAFFLCLITIISRCAEAF